MIDLEKLTSVLNIQIKRLEEKKEKQLHPWGPRSGTSISKETEQRVWVYELQITMLEEMIHDLRMEEFLDG